MQRNRTRGAAATHDYSDWKLTVVLPSVQLYKEPVLGKRLVAFGPDWPGYDSFLRGRPVLARFLARFSTPDGRRVRPAVVLARPRGPLPTSEELARFRNSMAVASVCAARRELATEPATRGILHTNYFDFCPFWIKEPHEDVLFVPRVAPVRGSQCEIDVFRGQPLVAAGHPGDNVAARDDLFLSALLKLWRTPMSGRNRERRERIASSLEFAYAAMRLPLTHFGSTAEQEVAMSSWVSAFEVLAFPPHGDVGPRDVTDALKKVPWLHRGLRRKDLLPVGRGANVKRHGKTTKPAVIYLRAYELRCGRLHGEVYGAQTRQPRRRRGWGNLALEVPALFRCYLLWELASLGCATIPTASGLPDNVVAWMEHNDYEKVLLGAKRSA